MVLTTYWLHGLDEFSPLVGVEELQGELWPQAGVATASLVVVVPEALVLGRLLAHPVHAYHSPPQASFKNMPLGH